MITNEFNERRRQTFLDEQSYENTLKWFDNDELILREKLEDQTNRPRAKSVKSA